jgi:polyferredoxin
VNQQVEEAVPARAHARVEDARRGLGRNRRLRLASAALWSSFMGATLSTMSLYLMPEDWLQPPATPEGAAGVFFTLWILSLIPAGFSMALAAGPQGER